MYSPAIPLARLGRVQLPIIEHQTQDHILHRQAVGLQSSCSSRRVRGQIIPPSPCRSLSGGGSVCDNGTLPSHVRRRPSLNLQLPGPTDKALSVVWMFPRADDEPHAGERRFGRVQLRLFLRGCSKRRHPDVLQWGHPYVRRLAVRKALHFGHLPGVSRGLSPASGVSMIRWRCRGEM